VRARLTGRPGAQQRWESLVASLPRAADLGQRKAPFRTLDNVHYDNLPANSMF